MDIFTEPLLVGLILSFCPCPHRCRHVNGEFMRTYENMAKPWDRLRKRDGHDDRIDHKDPKIAALFDHLQVLSIEGDWGLFIKVVIAYQYNVRVVTFSLYCALFNNRSDIACYIFLATKRRGESQVYNFMHFLCQVETIGNISRFQDIPRSIWHLTHMDRTRKGLPKGISPSRDPKGTCVLPHVISEYECTDLELMIERVINNTPEFWSNNVDRGDLKYRRSLKCFSIIFSAYSYIPLTRRLVSSLISLYKADPYIIEYLKDHNPERYRVLQHFLD